MAITRAYIDRFRSNLTQSFTTWQPIHLFNVKGSKVKVTAYVTGNADWLWNLCEFLAYLLLTRGVASRDLHLWLPRGTSQNAILSKKTQKMLIICQIDWSEVGVAFELQCLRNCTLSSFYSRRNSLLFRRLYMPWSCPSVLRHIPVFCRDEWSYDHAVFTDR